LNAINSIDDVGQLLKSHDINPSYQRVHIFYYLNKYRNHPTVDTIYKALHPKIPTLSKTTVYNTLKTFVEKKIVEVVIIEENEARYDVKSVIHAHFKCEQCNDVFDLEVEESHLEIPDLIYHQVNEKHLNFKGICKSCLPKST
jgi:Fur family ferric uptake transcriptional regulator/Fur family peroxide stress response transcriptional regulator